MHRLFIVQSLLLSLLLMFCAFPALAQDSLYPNLSDPVDRYMQQLAVMSQQDGSIGSLPYNQENIEKRGCAPLSIANPLIACFGVTEKETAADFVYEVMAVLTPKRQYRRKSIAPERIVRVLHQKDRAESTEDFPLLAQYVGGYSGEIIVTEENVTQEDIHQLLLSNHAQPPLFVGRLYVQDSWEEAVRIVYALHEAGFDDALFCLAYAGAGTASTGAPLRSGESGHYLGVCIHVGSFVSNGSLYILDSLPRALDHESYGPDQTCHVPYRFNEDEGAFRLTFHATRISPTVIRLSLRQVKLRQLTGLQQKDFPDKAARHAALVDLHTQQLAPLKLFGRCMAMISLRQIEY